MYYMVKLGGDVEQFGKARSRGGSITEDTSIISKEDSFRSLSSNDDLEGFNEDEMSLDVNWAKSVSLGVSTDSIGGWIVRKGMHTR
ncbi:hypothetical protein YC2023_033531 [Brassica napus]